MFLRTGKLSDKFYLIIFKNAFYCVYYILYIMHNEFRIHGEMNTTAKQINRFFTFHSYLFRVLSKIIYNLLSANFYYQYY